jgi:peptidoglycan/LPS O-acetylase OafA/YrhL
MKRFQLGHRPELNGLRALAVLSVMICHADEKLLRAGFIGVDFFFVISGFLITALLVEEFDTMKRISLKRFYMRRILRLAPALLVMLAVYCIATIFLYDWQRTYRNWGDALIVLLYAANWAGALAIHAPTHLGHAWSLSIEEQFYALWPPLLWLMLRTFRSRWLVAASAAAVALGVLAWRNYMFLAGAADGRIYNGTDTRADALMVGCFFGILLASNLIPREVRGAATYIFSVVGLIGLALLLALTAGPTWNAPIMFQWLYFGIALLTAVVILDCFMNPASVVKRVMAFKPLVWIGTVSYGLYLWHYPIFTILRDFRFTTVQILVLGNAMTFAIVTASYYLLEKPFLGMKKRYEAVRK